MLGLARVGTFGSRAAVDAMPFSRVVEQLHRNVPLVERAIIANGTDFPSRR